ncbi:MAG: hypothetical protein MJ201_01055 [Mycoplasmoidaceae bacterium]|nr:hypothetical protein [Mycoplasmoidaceae bacterium]
MHSRPQKISLAFEQPLSKDLDDCIVEFDYGDTTQKTTGHARLENVHVERYIAPIQPFETCDWDFIDRKATALEYGEITQEEFYKSFTVNNKTPTSMNDFIGVKRKVQLKHQDLNSNGVIDNNEVYQTVRVIGTSADNTSEYQVNRIEGNRKVALTFEFVDFISDANGYSVASF